MAPDQESSSGQIVKPPDNLCASDDDVKSSLEGEPLNDCILKDSGGSGDDSIPDIDPCNLVRLDWFQVHRVGAGLANLGNSCFLNTVIQCLTYCPPLANYLLQNDHCSSCQSFEFCMMCELQKHIKEALERSGDVIKPVHIYENLRFIAEHFQSGQQEDAHEFLRFVIENLWRASLYNYSNEQEGHTIRETTVINYIFGGYNRSQVVCLRCNKRSNTYEHFMDFILDIKHNANSLEKALEHYVKPEILEKDNAYNCPQCNTLVPAEKTYSIHRAPNVATIQLKRFDYNKTHGGKITKHVSYPENLDLRPFMSEKTDRPLWYKLNAVLVHVGQNCNSGHYYCYIRNSNGQWYLMDDARVQRVGLSDVLNQQAYLLFYVRVPVSNGNNVKRKNSLYINSPQKKNELLNGLNRSSAPTQCSESSSNRKHRVYMPLSKWASSQKNQWNGPRKPNFFQRWNRFHSTAKRANSHSSTSSVDEKSSQGSWESNSSGRSQGTKVSSQVNIAKNGFHPTRFRGKTEDYDVFNGRFYSRNSNSSDGQTTCQTSDDSYNKSNCTYKYSPVWKGHTRQRSAEVQRNGSHNYHRSYDKQPYSYRNFSRCASDTNLYMNSDHYSSSAENYRDTNYDWKHSQEFFEGQSQEYEFNGGSCRNEATFKDHDYASNQWSNGFQCNQKCYDGKNRHNYVKDNIGYRKFHEKSRSADFGFSRPRFYPYYNPRRQSYVQECF